jgi:hypothetical protein
MLLQLSVLVSLRTLLHQGVVVLPTTAYTMLHCLLTDLFNCCCCMCDCCAPQVVAYDFGIKHNILRRLASFGCSITVVPADYPADKVLALNPDGVFFSNGPVSILVYLMSVCLMSL